MILNNKRGPLAAKITINQFSEQFSDFDLCTDTPWVKKILDDLEKDSILDTPSSITPHLVIDLSIKYQNHMPYGAHLIIHGKITCIYRASCVRCLAPADQKSDFEFDVCYLNSIFEENPEYVDLTHIYICDRECELYFHEKGKLDLSALIQEQLLVRLEPLPLHHENCKGLCSTCGIDRNNEECSHVN